LLPTQRIIAGEVIHDNDDYFSVARGGTQNP
jgi:hypothetical protein